MADNGNVRVKLKNVRLSFPHLFTAKKGKDADSKAKFSAKFLMDKDTPEGKKNIKIIRDAIEEVKAAKWGKKPPKIKSDKICLVDGEPIDPETGEREALYDGYEGCMVFGASNERRPTILDRDKTPLTAADGVIYAGCYVNVIATVWAMDHKEYGKGIFASLEGVQFYRDGESFGAAGVSEDDFDDFDEDEDDFEDDEDERPRKSAKSKRRDDDEDEEEEDERPRRSSKSKRRDDDEDDEPRRPAKSKRRVRDYDDDDDDDLI